MEPLPLYKSHKTVRAAKIKAIVNDFEKNSIRIEFDGTAEVRFVNEQWIREKRPNVGGYYVEYEDGYSSYSPAKAFEDGYTKAPDETV